MNLLINYKFFYYLWVLVHLTLLVISGYLNKVALVLSMKNMSDFVSVHTHVYPIETQNIQYYDISEFAFFYLIGTIGLYIVKKWSTTKRQQYIRYL